MGGGDKNGVTRVFLAAWSPALKFTPDSSPDLETVSTELAFAFPGEALVLAVCQEGRIAHFFIYKFSVGQYFSMLCNLYATLKTQREQGRERLEGKAPLGPEQLSTEKSKTSEKRVVLPSESLGQRLQRALKHDGF